MTCGSALRCLKQLALFFFLRSLSIFHSTLIKDFFKFKNLNFSKTVNVNLNLLIPQKNRSELARKIVLNKFHSIFRMYSCICSDTNHKYFDKKLVYINTHIKSLQKGMFFLD